MLDWIKYVKVTSLFIVNIPSVIIDSTLAVEGKWVGFILLMEGNEIDTLNSHLMKYHCRGHQENWYGK